MMRSRVAVALATLLFYVPLWAQTPAPDPAARSSLPSRPLPPAELLSELRRGGYVLYFRHVSTDFSQNDERMKSFEDCAHQRNLTEKGRAEARAVGAAIRQLGIPFGRVLASPFCRTVDTATLVFGRVEKMPEVRGGPAAPANADRYAALRRILAAPVPGGTNLAVVGHGNPFISVAGPPYLAEGEAAVVDPRRDVDEYLAEAGRQGLRIRYVVETHLHAGFVSGHRELAERTGAEIVFGARAEAQFPHRAVKDADELPLGKALLRILETPGHTPESISVLVFENKGEVVGVSNPHPHCQIYATNFVFKTIELEAEAQHGRSLFRQIIQAEEDDGRRLLVRRDQALSFIPYFARYPYETYVAPRETYASLADLSTEELSDFAAVLRETLIRLDNLWRMSFPYVMVLHQAPTDRAYPGFHFHIQIHPPLRKPGLLKYLAGPEIGGGNFLNDTAPEEKAAELQAVSNVHYTQSA